VFELLHKQIEVGFRDLRVHLDQRLNVLNKELFDLSKTVMKMALNFDGLKAAVQTVADNQNKLADDQAKDSADILAAIAKLGTITPTNPADQATIDAVTATLTDIANKQQTTSAALEQSAADLEKAIA